MEEMKVSGEREMDIKKSTTEKLREMYKEIESELRERQKRLQETCEHPSWVDVMYMRPGAFYIGCSVCQIGKGAVYSECMHCGVSIDKGYSCEKCVTITIYFSDGKLCLTTVTDRFGSIWVMEKVRNLN